MYHMKYPSDIPIYLEYVSSNNTRGGVHFLQDTREETVCTTECPYIMQPILHTSTHSIVLSRFTVYLYVTAPPPGKMTSLQM